MTTPYKVAITGGSSGIGFAVAEAYAKLGAEIVLFARNIEKLSFAQEQLRTIPDAGNIHIVSVDLTDYEATQEAFISFRNSEVGFVPDLLVNSAGVIIPGEFATMSLSDFKANLDSGFWTVVHPCKVVAPWMKEAKSGHIVNVSSVAGYMGVYGYTGYSAAKFATMGFTEALRCELKPEGVAVSVVCPPDTNTPALEKEKTMRPPETDAIAGSLAPVDPKVIANAIVKGVKKGKYLIIPGAISKLYFRVKGLLPEVVYAVMDGDVKKSRKTRGM